MRGAFGQAQGYAHSFDVPVPFLVVCDIGYCFDLYASFDGSYAYRHFPNAQRSRIFLKDLEKEEHRQTLRRIFTDPRSLDPSLHAAKVTRQVAEKLAKLAQALEKAGHPSEAVAKFLMRCLFTMFAEDVGLLPSQLFTKALKDHWLESPASFPGGIERLWRTMNTGGEFGFVVEKILRFNGGLFIHPTALPMTREHLELLLDAAKRAVRQFHQKLCATKVLDPACGSGNFLYVTLDLFKRLESEVLALLEGLGEKQTLLHAETIRVTPGQFLGIEIKPWAKEIAELVLWIGYLQHHFRTQGKAVPPPEPVLQDDKNIECRDAVLAYDGKELVRDEAGMPITRWDGETARAL